jgi:esterase/lipase superfamily enzyme
MQYVDDALPRTIDGWRSTTLGVDVPIAIYGERGRPLLLFPAASADFLENEHFFLVKAIELAILAGRVRLFAIDSINRHAWMNDRVPIPEKARRQNLYARYVEDEVVPFIRALVEDDEARIGTAGASFGAFHAVNMLCRRPDLFDTVIAMSGFYDLGPEYLRGYHDDCSYFNNPTWYLPGLEGRYLELLRTSCGIHLMAGQGAYEDPGAARAFSALLAAKGIPHELDVWGQEVNPDWPWWRKMLPCAIDRLGW